MRRILIQLDTDPHPSVFDRVVAVDSDVDELFSYGSVGVDDVEALVHGGMFTRGPKDLKNTAVFVGGSRVSDGEAVFEQVQRAFFGPVRLSVMMDSNGSNTTAAAAVLAARQHLDFSSTRAIVLGGTGPVGQRVGQLLAARGAEVVLGSRSLARAEQTCDFIRETHADASLTGLELAEGWVSRVEKCNLLVAAGAAGVEFLSSAEWQTLTGLQVAIDVNAVPPVGLEGIDVMSKAVDVNGVTTYGAIGVGGLKMKIHKAAVRSLFESNEAVLETEAIYAIGEQLLAD